MSIEILPELQIKDGFYYRPYIPPEYPETSEDYLPDNVQLHFEFGPHTHADHFDAAADRLEKADIYIPEAYGYRKDLPHFYAGLVAGTVHPPSTDPFSNAARDALKGSKKIICLADITEEELESMPQLPQLLRIESLADLAASSYDETYSRQFLTDARDIRILSNIGRVITEAVSSSDDLKSKSTVSVLATLGTAHMPVYQQLSHNPQVSAAEWRNDRPTVPRIAHRTVLDKIASNQPVSQEDLIKRGLTYNRKFHVVRTHDNHPQVEAETVALETIFNDMPNGLDALFRLVKGRATKEERAYFRALAINAQQVTTS